MKLYKIHRFLFWTWETLCIEGKDYILEYPKITIKKSGKFRVEDGRIYKNLGQKAIRELNKHRRDVK